MWEEIEAQYCRSVYVKEICVLRFTDDGDRASDGLFAVVVPDMALMRQRRIANAGDLLRFELEGQSIHLPLHQRVVAYTVWFAPLPRTGDGTLDRREIAEGVRRRREEARRRASNAERIDDWEGDAHALATLAIIRRRAGGATLWPQANLELDLALDSIDRVELIAEVERRFGVRVPQESVHEILTVQHLIDAVRPAAAAAGAAPDKECWAGLLDELSDRDHLVAPLLVRRRFTPVVFFVLLRLLRLVLPRIIVVGREHLPTAGPYIISPNHQSYLDPLFLCSVLPFDVVKQVFFVGASEYFETALTSWLARRLNLLAVDPDANLLPALRAGAFGLTRGRILVLFPEGERSIDGTIKRFKKGAAILGRQVGVPIVPVAIDGVFALWPRNRAVNWRLLLPGSGHRVRIAFGSPFRVSEGDSYADAAAALRRRVSDLWDAPNGSPQDGREHRRRHQAAGEQNASLRGLPDKQ
jgi:long-chain acyl-CoA synthetase